MSLLNYFSAAKTSPSKKRSRAEMTSETDKENANPDPSNPNATTATEADEIASPPRKRIRLADEDAKDASSDEENENPRDIPDEITFTNGHLALPNGWYRTLENEFQKSYFKNLLKELAKEERAGQQIFPPAAMVYRAFELCDWDDLKVVILGQDPYHDDNQAEGLCFSIPRGVKCKFPSSLRNIYKEAAQDIGFTHPQHGSLVEWGERGVLLLNTGLTVRAHKANSHKKFGWQKFTSAVISVISRHHDGVVFILWGKQAQKQKTLIDLSKHRVIESAHPSGLSAHRGFFQSKPFSKSNALLQELGKDPIDWQITP